MVGTAHHVIKLSEQSNLQLYAFSDDRRLHVYNWRARGTDDCCPPKKMFAFTITGAVIPLNVSRQKSGSFSADNQSANHLKIFQHSNQSSDLIGFSRHSEHAQWKIYGRHAKKMYIWKLNFHVARQFSIIIRVVHKWWCIAKTCRIFPVEGGSNEYFKWMLQKFPSVFFWFCIFVCKSPNICIAESLARNFDWRVAKRYEFVQYFYKCFIDFLQFAFSPRFSKTNFYSKIWHEGDFCAMFLFVCKSRVASRSRTEA